MGRLGASLDEAKLGSPSAGLPSPRGYSYHMQYRTFISQPARYVAYERGKDLSTSLEMTIRSSALHSCHTDRCVEGCLFVPLYPAPSPRASQLACHTVTFFYTLPLKKSRRSWCFSGILQTTLFLLFSSSPFRRFFWRYRAIPGECFPERGR